MTVPAIRSWQAVQDEVRRRIADRVWRPGDFITHETDLAREFGCARATVNRALRQLAEEGLLDRRRKAGTRVAVNPVRRARFSIPVIRDEIEARGHVCRHAVLAREMREPPPDVRARMRTAPGLPLLRLQTLYTADGAPYVLENRWINPQAVPAAGAETFVDISPNEWLVREVPFEGGDFTFSAMTAYGHHVGAPDLPRRLPDARGIVTTRRLLRLSPRGQRARAGRRGDRASPPFAPRPEETMNPKTQILSAGPARLGASRSRPHMVGRLA